VISRIHASDVPTKVAISFGLGALVALAFLIVSSAYPLPVMIGALPGPMALASALGTALAALALLSSPSSRKPSLSMPIAGLYRLLMWWLGVALALALVAFAAWRVWGIVFAFAAILASVKVLSVFSYIKQEYEFRPWQPFAVIIGAMALLVAVLMFFTRSQVPPPVTAAVSAYRSEPSASQRASRPAPDLSDVGLKLDVAGDQSLGGLPTTFFSYRSATGTRVDIYEADYGFPAPFGSTRDGAGWTARVDDVSLRAGASSREFMIVASSSDIVDWATEALAGSEE
jgi:hypothetical protein